ncbi:MAG: hypothetical protein ISR65_06985 [Bacteriovoracaceae bacterium]|nr:hypothetical protein [Bacteriovoracaceae bacterium]
MKKILIKPPATSVEAILCFPFIHAVALEFPDAQINIILEDSVVNYFELTGVNYHVYTFPKKNNSLLGIHHYSYNLQEVFNIDLFFDLENTFKSSFMGFCFRAKERIGFAAGMNKLFLTHQLLPKVGSANACGLEKKLDLLEFYLQKDFSTLSVQGQLAAKQRAIKKEDSFILLVLSNGQALLQRSDFWQEFFNSFYEQRFVICTPQLNEDLKSCVTKANLNEFIWKSYGNMSEIYDFITMANVVITDNLIVSTIANYFNNRSFVIDSPTSTISMDYNHFPTSPYFIKFNSLNSSSNLPVSINSKDVCTELGEDKISSLVEFIQNVSV